MATFTPKNKSATSTSKVKLNIGSGYFLNIGGYNLVIQPASDGTILTARSKNSASLVGRTKS